MVNLLEESFPGLTRSGYNVTSPRDKGYNCIAYAANDTRRWWWPWPMEAGFYWPPDVEREATVEAFVRSAMQSLGKRGSDRLV